MFGGVLDHYISVNYWKCLLAVVKPYILDCEWFFLEREYGQLFDRKEKIEHASGTSLLFKFPLKQIGMIVAITRRPSFFFIYSKFSIVIYISVQFIIIKWPKDKVINCCRNKSSQLQYFYRYKTVTE